MMTDFGFIYVILAYACFIFGICMGILIILRSFKQPDRIMLINLLVLGLVYIFFGVFYFVLIILRGDFIPASILSSWLRPMNVLLLLIPYLIIKRLGL